MSTSQQLSAYQSLGFHSIEQARSRKSSNIQQVKKKNIRDSQSSLNEMEMQDTQDIMRYHAFSDESSEDEKISQHSFLQQQQNEKEIFNDKLKYQRRALFRKNATLQFRQVGTNICQILTPILGLLVIVAMREMGGSNLKMLSGAALYIPIPYLFNIPYKPFSTLGQLFNITDCNQWYMYQFDESISEQDKEFWGENKGKPMQSPVSNGMIRGRNNILEYPCKDINRSVPYFEEFTDKNLTINHYLKGVIDNLHQQDINFYEKNQQIQFLDDLPDGAITVQEANKEKLKYKLQINDHRYFSYHRNNGVTKLGVISDSDQSDEDTQYMLRSIEGQIQVADMINQAYIRELFQDTHIVNGIQFMPFRPTVDTELERIINLIGLAVFPSCLCLALPVFIYTLVLEKETKLVETMKINGMKMFNYWYVNFSFNFLIYFFTAGLYWFVGAIVFKLNFFTATSWKLMLTVYFGWGLCQISMAFFISVFLNTSQTASIIGYSLSIWLCTFASSMNITIYQLPSLMSWFLYPFPTFPFCRVMYHMAMDCAYGTCIQDMSKMHPEAINCIIAIYIEAFVYMILALYLYQVVPQTYGVPKHPLFFLRSLKIKFINNLIFGNEENIAGIELNEEEKKLLEQQEDEDAKQQRRQVHSLHQDQYFKYPLIAKDIRKVYPGFSNRPPKIANRSICLKVNRGELFGLLGPNGAGKTTLISMLTGMFKPTKGNSWIAGYDIKNQLEQVQLQIGVCPQFDILWNDLTVEEHLLFYARLKGIQPEDESQMVDQALEEVQLTPEKNVMTKNLPLGMKRRLSIAISLVANPKIVFLDEPTTGLDPETRRQLWNILQDCKSKQRAMVLTTHSMEEADVLCNRIGIVNNGVLRCIGSQVRLKTLYGGGYHLFVNCQKSKQIKNIVEKKRQKEHRRGIQSRRQSEDVDNLQVPNSLGNVSLERNISNLQNELDEQDDFEVAKVHSQIMSFVKKLLPQAMLLREFSGNFVYQIPLEGFNAERLFVEMEKNKEKLKIADWGISQCTLEDVFTRICSEI